MKREAMSFIVLFEPITTLFWLKYWARIFLFNFVFHIFRSLILFKDIFGLESCELIS